MKSIMTVKDLCLWYGKAQALKNISMEIPEKSNIFVELKELW